jgi:hypothetical protein
VFVRVPHSFGSILAIHGSRSDQVSRVSQVPLQVLQTEVGLQVVRVLENAATENSSVTERHIVESRTDYVITPELNEFSSCAPNRRCQLRSVLVA